MGRIYFKSSVWASIINFDFFLDFWTFPSPFYGIIRNKWQDINIIVKFCSCRKIFNITMHVDNALASSQLCDFSEAKMLLIIRITLLASAFQSKVWLLITLLHWLFFHQLLEQKELIYCDYVKSIKIFNFPLLLVEAIGEQEPKTVTAVSHLLHPFLRNYYSFQQ